MLIILALLISLATTPQAIGEKNMEHVHVREKILMKTETFELKDFTGLFGKLKGISEEQLKAHNELYKGYVKKFNEVNEKLKTAYRTEANQNYSEYRSLVMELSHNLNGAVFHEFYFSNLTTDFEGPSEELVELIEKDFGDWKNYIEDLKATGMASRSGWAITAYNYRDGKIYNFIIDQHNMHVPAFVRPLLVLDTWEHAFMIDYETDKKSYINAFLDNVNWQVVYDRLNSTLETDKLLEQSTE